MSDCGEPCDACGNRGTHHLCDTCCEEEAKALEAKLSEVQAVLTEDVRLDQWEKCGIIDSAFIANLRQARRERDEARACLAFERVTVAELRAEVERLRLDTADLLARLDAAAFAVQHGIREVAERQKAAMLAAINDDSYASYDGAEVVGILKAVPLVTEGDK